MVWGVWPSLSASTFERRPMSRMYAWGAAPRGQHVGFGDARALLRRFLTILSLFLKSRNKIGTMTYRGWLRQRMQHARRRDWGVVCGTLGGGAGWACLETGCLDDELVDKLGAKSHVGLMQLPLILLQPCEALELLQAPLLALLRGLHPFCNDGRHLGESKARQGHRQGPLKEQNTYIRISRYYARISQDTIRTFPWGNRSSSSLNLTHKQNIRT